MVPRKSCGHPSCNTMILPTCIHNMTDTTLTSSKVTSTGLTELYILILHPSPLNGYSSELSRHRSTRCIATRPQRRRTSPLRSTAASMEWACRLYLRRLILRAFHHSLRSLVTSGSMERKRILVSLWFKTKRIILLGVIALEIFSKPVNFLSKNLLIIKFLESLGANPMEFNTSTIVCSDKV